MALTLLSVLAGGCATHHDSVARLDFPLPPQARYSVTERQFKSAAALLDKDFLADTNRLKSIVASPCMCGPGLWHLLKDSPAFAVPPRAKTICQVPMGDGHTRELPAALIQDAVEAANFRAALAGLLSGNGAVTCRLPTETEFNQFWAVMPFDDISAPLVVADGRDYDLIILFVKQRPFWFDAVGIAAWER